MSLALMLQTDARRFLLAISIPPYQPSPLLAVIVALALAIAGMLADVALGLTVGAVALPMTAAALVIVFAVLFYELLQQPVEGRPAWTI